MKFPVPVNPRSARTDCRHELDALDTSALREAANWFMLTAGTANVIMQLSMQAVAYGVIESKVDEANLFKNPRRRARTTLSYVAVAMLGTAEQRAAIRSATNRSHAQVRSAPGGAVGYNAFNPALQKWVTACLYKGAEDAYTFVHGALSADYREQFYRQGIVFGTTLQLPPDEWPATRDEFESYWRESLSKLEMDDLTREYLWRIVRLEYLKRRIPAALLRLRARLVAGYLGPTFRALMRMPWTPADQQSFDRFNRRLAAFMRIVPRHPRTAPDVAAARCATPARRGPPDVLKPQYACASSAAHRSAFFAELCPNAHTSSEAVARICGSAGRKHAWDE